MKTKVEIEGYEIEISFENGMISVSAQKDDEVVEEFSINVEEDSEEGEEDKEEIQNFGDYDEEEDFSDRDLEDESQADEDEDESQDEEETQGSALESFQSFINKKK